MQCEKIHCSLLSSQSFTHQVENDQSGRLIVLHVLIVFEDTLSLSCMLCGHHLTARSFSLVSSIHFAYSLCLSGSPPTAERHLDRVYSCL